jgi:IclR family transcriptional regulator, pca regulon regulatory protein
VLEGNASLTIASSAPRRILGIFTRIGTHLPALSTATGRVLLAGRPDDAIDNILRSARIQRLTPKTKISSDQIWDEIHRIRRAGYGLNDEEIEVGLRVIAVPVHDNRGSIIASMCVSTYSGRYEVDQLTEKFLQPLLKASEKLERLL